MTKKRLKPSDLLKLGWCQRDFAKNRIGDTVDPDSKQAVAWCLSGAAKATIRTEALYESWVDHIMSVTGVTIAKWNDRKSRTKAQVLRLAIQVEKEMGL